MMLHAMIAILILDQVMGGAQISSKDANTNLDLQCLQDGLSVKLTCAVNPLSSPVIWAKDGATQATCSNTGNTCLPAAAANARYSFTSDYVNGEYHFTIANVDSNVDKGNYTCEHSTDLPRKELIPCECPVESVEHGQVNTTSATVAAGTVVGITCDQGYTLQGSSELTCQADQTWNNPWPTCGTTTTTTTTTSTSTTTTTTPPPTTTTTIPSTTTTTSTMTTTPTPTTTTTTTTTSTTSTTPMPTRTTTTTTPSTTARPTTQSPPTTPITSTSVTPSTTTPSNTRGESNTSLIAMIVVVSVIGGILVIAIVFMILVMVYGKSGLPLISHRKGTHHRPPFHHHHHRHHKHHKRRERSEHSFYQPQNVLAGYSFYRGGVENPVFQESMDYPNSPDLHYKDANEGLHAPRYDEQPPEYQYAVNWEYGVD